MSLVLVGLSYRSAPVRLLERASVGTEDLGKLLSSAVGCPHVTEAVALSTCNRVELYADVVAFHTGVAELTALLATAAGVPPDELSPHLNVHYEDRAVQHLFQVVSGLDSMVVGEAQILGQVREAFRIAQREGTAHRTLGGLFPQALRVGKRAHAETGIDRSGSLFVDAGLRLVTDALVAGAPANGAPVVDGPAVVHRPLTGSRAVVVGAGSMSALALRALIDAGAVDLVVANRATDRADRVASRHGARAVPLSALAEVAAAADLVVFCTAASGPILGRDDVRDLLRARARGPRAGQELFLLDLAMPRDVDPEAAELAGVTLFSLEDLGRTLDDAGHAAQVQAVRAIVGEEVAGYLAQRQADRVAPTVVALRTLAADVVDAEMARFDARTPGLDPSVRVETEQAVRRVVDKLLHLPTVRVKELASEPSGLAYAEALRALFDLEVDRYRETVAADVHAVEVDLGSEP
jgi:glutamyl-tRNA reductase